MGKASKERQKAFRKAVRMKISNDISNRKKVWLRDRKGTGTTATALCVYCKMLLTQKQFTVDHIISRFNGGNNEMENLVICCYTCNVLKNRYVDTQPEIHFCL